MTNIIYQAKSFLRDALMEFKANTVSDILPFHEQFWAFPSSDPLSFMILIKGIIPSSLVSLVYAYTESFNTSSVIVSELIHYIHDMLHTQIWIPRCEFVKITEKAAGIDHTARCSPTTSRNRSHGSKKSHSLQDVPLYLWSQHATKWIESGLDILDVKTNFYFGSNFRRLLNQSWSLLVFTAGWLRVRLYFFY
jgi:hypothetical protein